MVNENDLEKWQKLGAELYEKLRLLTFPIAVRFIRNLQKELPPGVLRPKALGRQMTLCQSFTMVRRTGLHMAQTLEDNQCSTSSVCHGWGEMDQEDLIQSQVISKYHADADAERKISLARKLLPPGEFQGMVMSPLPKTIIEPLVVLVYGNPAQIFHLVQSLSYHGRAIHSNFYDYGESCMKGLIDPYLTNEPQVVLPGTGDRAAALTTDDEMAMGLPASLVGEAVENLFKSAGRMGVKQPINWLPPQLPQTLEPLAWQFNRDKIAAKKAKAPKN